MTASTRHRWDIDDILTRTDLGALLDEYAQPAGSARGRRWHCPVRDHTDSNASVTMYTDARGHERWRCWSGDDTHRGDAIDLIATVHSRTRGDAIDDLAARAGLRPNEPLPPPAPKRTVPSARTRAAPDESVIAYVDACAKILWSRAGAPVRDWLHQRGFTNDTLEANRVGADPGRRMLHRKRGIPYGATLGATFPALDPNGRVRYVQTRYLEPQPKGPKYDNPSRELAANPRLAWTVPIGERQLGRLIVCEGIPDALVAAQAGYASAGVLGSQYPDPSVAERLAVRAERDDLAIVAIIDADDAGRTWGHRLADHLHTAGRSITLIEPPALGMDLNDWARVHPEWATELDRSLGAAHGIEGLGIDAASPGDLVL